MDAHVQASSLMQLKLALKDDIKIKSPNYRAVKKNLLRQENDKCIPWQA